MRPNYLLFTVTTLLGLTCGIGLALPTDHPVGKHISYALKKMEGNNCWVSDNTCRPKMTGGDHGEWFYQYGCNDGSTISKFEMWTGYMRTNAIRITYTDGKTLFAGKEDGRKGEISLQPGEYLTQLSLWGNSVGTGLGAIKFKTNLNKEFDHGMDRARGSEYTYDIWSGVLCGMYGMRTADEVSAVGFFFLPEVESSHLHSMTYSNLDNAQSHTVKLNKAQVQFSNSLSIPQSYEFTGEETWTESHHWKKGENYAWTDSFKIGLGASIPIGKSSKTTQGSAEAPTVNLSCEYGWSKTTTKIDEKTGGTTEAKRNTYRFPVVAPPETDIVASLVVAQDVHRLRYNGIWTLNFVEGGSYSMRVKGMYEGVTSRKADIVMGPAPGRGRCYAIKWQKCTNGGLPDEVDIHGHQPDGDCLVIARCHTSAGGVIPGKAGDKTGGCKYVEKSESITNQEFEVLVINPQKLSWIPVSGRITNTICPVTHVLFAAGRDEKGNKYYVGRTQLGGGLNIGKTGYHMEGLEYIDNDNNVKLTRVYEVLCVQAGFRERTV